MTWLLLAALMITGASSVHAESLSESEISVAPISERSGRVSVAAQYSGTITPKFVQERGAVISAHYSFTDTFKLGLVSGFFDTKHTSAGNYLWRLQGGTIAGTAIPPDQYALQWMVAAEAQLTAIHGQLRLGDTAINNFEIFVPLGLGFAGTRAELVRAAGDEASYDKRVVPIVHLGLGARAHLTPWLALAIDFRDSIFLEPAPSESGVSFRPQMQAGLQLSFGSNAALPEPFVSSDANSRSGQVEVSGQLSVSFFDRFISSVGPSLGVGYHFTDTWALEFFGSKFFAGRSNYDRRIMISFPLPDANPPGHTHLLWLTGLTAQWSPLSGRLRAFGYTLDATPFVGVGVGVGGTRISCDVGMVLNQDRYGDGARCPRLDPTESDPGAVAYTPTTLQPVGILMAGVRFRLSQIFALRVEAKDHVYIARVVQPHLLPRDQDRSQVRHQVLSHIGLSFFF